MKRFYSQVTVAEAGNGAYLIHLDGRPLKTPKRAVLRLPNHDLAAAIEAEWAGQGEDIEPRSLPLTQLANSGLDGIAPNRAAMVATVAEFAAADLICYGAEAPAELVRAQVLHWRPLIRWAEGHYDVTLRLTAGIVPVAQSEATLAAYARAVEAFDDLALAALHDMATLTKSLTIALALSAGEIDLEAAWAAARVDEAHQQARWGVDPEAAEIEALRRADLGHALRFFQLLA